METTSKHLIILGRVQGVGFRYFTYKTAKELRVKGWVQNLQDGTVEAVVSGSPENVDKIVDRLKDGPPSSSVQNIKEIDDSIDSNQFNDFSIRR